MGMVFRHLLAVTVLPFTVTILVPAWIARRYEIVPALGASGGLLLVQGGGLVLLGVGVLLFLSSLRRFVSDGQGTLAPWDPPQHLVVRGPYRFVRNPMISGVLFVLAGEAMLLASQPHALWALTFLGINMTYIPLIEEPSLRRRFGEPYGAYCRHVPRLLPRLRPWGPDQQPEDAG